MHIIHNILPGEIKLLARKYLLLVAFRSILYIQNRYSSGNNNHGNKEQCLTIKHDPELKSDSIDWSTMTKDKCQSILVQAASLIGTVFNYMHFDHITFTLFCDLELESKRIFVQLNHLLFFCICAPVASITIYGLILVR